MRWMLTLAALATLSTPGLAKPTPSGKEGVDWAHSFVKLPVGRRMWVIATTTRPAHVPIPKVQLAIDGKVVAWKEGQQGATVSVSHLLAGGHQYEVLAFCSGPTNQQKIGATCTLKLTPFPPKGLG